MSRMSVTGSSLAELASVVRRLPQVLINVPVRDRIAVSESDEVADAVNAVEEELGDTGRVLLRPSGTEQLVRVMVEAPTQEQADAVAHRLAEVVAAGRADSPGSCVSRTGLRRSPSESGGVDPGPGTLGAMCGIVGYVGPQGRP